MVKDNVVGAGGVLFDSRAGQIERKVPNDSPPLRHFLASVAQALSREDGPHHSSHVSA